MIAPAHLDISKLSKWNGASLAPCFVEKPFTSVRFSNDHHFPSMSTLVLHLTCDLASPYCSIQSKDGFWHPNPQWAHSARSKHALGQAICYLGRVSGALRSARLLGEKIGSTQSGCVRRRAEGWDSIRINQP